MALKAIARRAELESTSRLELYRQLAQRLRSIVAFPEETLEGMTDEQYVRNIVDLIYRPTLDTNGRFKTDNEHDYLLF